MAAAASDWGPPVWRPAPPRLLPVPVAWCRGDRLSGMQRRDYRLRVGESILLPVHGPRPARRLHDRAVGGAAEVDRDEAGVLDQAADQSLRRLVLAAQPLDDATVAARPAAAAWKPAVSVLNDFV